MQHIWGLSIKGEIFHLGRREIRDCSADSARVWRRDMVRSPRALPAAIWVMCVTFKYRADGKSLKVLRRIVLGMDNKNQTAQNGQGTQSQEGAHFTSNCSPTPAGPGAVDGEADLDLFLLVALLQGMLSEQSLVFGVGIIKVEEESEGKAPGEEERAARGPRRGPARHGASGPTAAGLMPLLLPPLLLKGKIARRRVH